MNNNLTVGLIGFGYWGPNIAKQISKNASFKLKYICDIDYKRLIVAKSIYSESLVYTQKIEDLLTDNEIDAIFVATPTESHYELSKLVLTHNKHLYVEKPFTRKVAEAMELNKIATDRNLVVHIDHIMIFHPIIQKIHEVINSGELGDIIYIESSRMNLGRVKSNISSFWDLTIHDMSIIFYWFRELDFVDINLVGSKHLTDKFSIASLNAMTNSMVINFRSSWLSPVKERRITIIGSSKMLVYDDMESVNKVIIYDKGVEVNQVNDYQEFVILNRDGDAYSPYVPFKDALYESIQCFHNSIISGSQSISNIAFSIKLQTVMEKVEKI